MEEKKCANECLKHQGAVFCTDKSHDCPCHHSKKEILDGWEDVLRGADFLFASEEAFLAAKRIIADILHHQRLTLLQEAAQALDDLKWTVTMEDLKGQVFNNHHYVRIKHVNAKLLEMKSAVKAIIRSLREEV